MERNISIKIIDRIAYADRKQTIICNNDDYTITFTFDDEWAGIEAKTARFQSGSSYSDIVFTGNVVEVPVIQNAGFVRIGVFAEGITSTPANVYCEESILCDGGEVADPPADVYGQIIELLNGISAAPSKTEIIEAVYPVGSIYVSVNEASPETLFGGSWEQIKDMFLLSAGDTYAAGTTGGEAEHVLTEEEIPEHTHTYVRSMPGTYKTPASTSSSAQEVCSYMSTTKTGKTGDGVAHNNMPPYLTVYMWKRTA